MKPSEALRRGAEQISKGWNQGGLAIDFEGHLVSPESSEAFGWCAVGGVEAVNNGFSYAVRMLYEELSGRSLIQDNDHPETTQGDMILAMLLAAEILEGQGN
jgi:hypothetical protein